MGVSAAAFGAWAAANAGTIALVGLGLSAVGMGVQAVAARKAAKAQEKANKAAQAQAAIENRRRRIGLIRQQQQAQAQAELVQTTQGGGGVSTSMATGALATATTQGAVNLGDFAAFGAAGSRINSAQLAMGRAQSLANTGAAIAQFGSMMFSNAGRLGSMGQAQPMSPAGQRSFDAATGQGFGASNFQTINGAMPF